MGKTLVVRVILILTLLLLNVPLALAAPATSPLAAGNYALPNGHFYTEANGEGGAGGTGYPVVDEYWDKLPDSQVMFFREFTRLGGVQGVGYPASRAFMWDGFVSQVMQKGVFQWHPEVNRVYFVNVFDEMHKRGMDTRLYTQLQVPYMADWSGDTGKSWSQVVARHLAMLDGYPSLRAKYYSIANPLELYGLPMSPVVDFGPFYAVRLQRAVFQLYKVNTSYARAGDVLIANGGDVAKQLGLIPAAAARPYGTPRWSDKILAFEPNMGNIVGTTIHVEGDAVVFEAQFEWEIQTQNGQTLKRGPARSSYCCGWARFAFDIDMSGIAAQPVILVLFDSSPATGVPIGTVDIALDYRPAGAIIYPAVGAQVTLPIHLMARLGQPGEEVMAILKWGEGQELSRPFTLQKGEDGKGLLITNLDWNSESQPPQHASQPATLLITNSSGTVLAQQSVAYLSSNDPNTIEIKLYWVLGDQLQQVTRRIPKTVRIGTAALEELLWGPTPGNLAGFTTAIPTPGQVLSYPGRQPDWGPHVTLLGLNIQNGVATADFSQELKAYGGGSTRVMLIRQQIRQTLLQFSTIQDVRIAIEGQTEGVLEP